ncbi:MAG: hypothetical protein AMS24_02065 [Chlamydiae bacterium SM23_39]|nr:MAG: hypothetical protein AMS24_02065 [Chlamydiae bacterium SM23_39]
MFIINKYKNGKTISESAIEGKRLNISSEHLSIQGVIYGGRILELVEYYAQIVAERHSEAICKKKSVDFVRIFSAAKKEDILICYASINRSWVSSMEIGVKVISEDFRLLERKDILSAYFTFDSFDENNNLKKVSCVICETKEQKKRFMEANKRREIRIKKKN